MAYTPQFIGGSDPSTLDPVVTAAIGSFSKEHFYNILEKRPFLHTLIGRPGNFDEALRFNKANTAPGHRMLEGSPAVYEQIVFQTAGTDPTWIQGYDQWEPVGGNHTGWMQYAWRYVVKPLAISFQEKIENQGGARGIKLVDLMRMKVEVGIEELVEHIGTKVVTSDGTGTGSKEMLGLAGIIFSDPSTAGTTLGGWDVSTHTNLRNKYNADLPGAPAAGAAGDFGTNGPSYIRRMYNETYTALKHQRNRCILTSQDIHESWEGLLLSRDFVQRPYNGGLGRPAANEGYVGIRYKEAEVVWDPSVPAGTMYFLGFPALRLNTLKQLWLRVMPWKEHYSQLAQATVIACGLQMSCGQPSANGIIDGFTTT